EVRITRPEGRPVRQSLLLGRQAGHQLHHPEPQAPGEDLLKGQGLREEKPGVDPDHGHMGCRLGDHVQQGRPFRIPKGRRDDEPFPETLSRPGNDRLRGPFHGWLWQGTPSPRAAHQWPPGHRRNGPVLPHPYAAEALRDHLGSGRPTAPPGWSKPPPVLTIWSILAMLEVLTGWSIWTLAAGGRAPRGLERGGGDGKHRAQGGSGHTAGSPGVAQPLASPPADGASDRRGGL